MPEQEIKKIEIGDGAAIPEADDWGLKRAWWIAFCGTIGLLIALPMYKPDTFGQALAFIPDGILVTFQVTVLSMALAIVIGLLTGLGRLSKNRFINLIASLYVEIVRGIPLLVQLFYIYFALGRFVRVPDIIAAVVAMAFCYGAYMGEVIRAGIKSIDFGQSEAALSQGFTPGQSMRYVILPQALRTILPPVGNEFIALLKDTSLVSIIAVSDILRRGREYAAESFNYFETYTIVALVYLLITLILSRIISNMELRLGYYEKR